jgi:hypothetical protein
MAALRSECPSETNLALKMHSFYVIIWDEATAIKINNCFCLVALSQGVYRNNVLPVVEIFTVLSVSLFHLPWVIMSVRFS